MKTARYAILARSDQIRSDQTISEIKFSSTLASVEICWVGLGWQVGARLTESIESMNFMTQNPDIKVELLQTLFQAESR